MQKTNQTAADPSNRLVNLKARRSRAQTGFDLDIGATERAALAREFGLTEIRKLRLKGQFIALNEADWSLEAVLGATIVQSCIVSGAPVTTRIDAPVRRVFQKDFHLPDGTGEIEFDGQDEIEPLPETVDLSEILAESLALSIPEYPRADGVDLGEAVFTAPGVAPLRDKDVKPFAALAALRDKLGE